MCSQKQIICAFCGFFISIMYSPSGVNSFIFVCGTNVPLGCVVAQLVEALHYKLAGRRFDS